MVDATAATPASTQRQQQPITAYFMETEAPSAKRRRKLGDDAVHALTAEQVAQQPAPAAPAAADHTILSAAAAQLPPNAQCPIGLTALPAILPSALAVAAPAAAAKAATQKDEDLAGHTAEAQAAELQPGLQQAQPVEESDPIEDASLPAHVFVPAADDINSDPEAGQCYDEGNAHVAADAVQPRPPVLHCQETIGGDSGLDQCSLPHQTTSTCCFLFDLWRMLPIAGHQDHFMA